MNVEKLYPIERIIILFDRVHTAGVISTWYRRFLLSFQTGTCGTYIDAGTLSAARFASAAILSAKAYPLAVDVLP